MLRLGAWCDFLFFFCILRHAEISSGFYKHIGNFSFVYVHVCVEGAPLGRAQLVKNPPAICQETQVLFLGWEVLLLKG